MTTAPVADLSQQNVQPQQQNDPAKEVAPSPHNPSEEGPADVLRRAGITQEDVKTFIDIAKTYRESWSNDRILRIPGWMKNVMFDRGQQVLGWDPEQKTYFDALAYFRGQGKNDEADEVESFVNNITQMMKMAFVGTLSRSVPPTVIRPENAEVLADITTAKASQQAISIIERMNHAPALVRMQAAFLFLYGVYFKQTRFVIDGEWAGYDEDDILGDVPINKPHRLRCANCGTETPTSQLQPTTEDQPCPNCSGPIGPGDFYPEEQDTTIGVTGTHREPRGMVKWTIYSPLEVDVNPKAKDLNGTPILALDQEIDISEARATWPGFIDKIQEGTESSSSVAGTNERYRRAESKLMGAPQEMADPTLSQLWFTPRSYWRTNDKVFAKRMRNMFPQGVKLSLIGDTALDIRPKALMKEWSCGRLNDEHGLLPPAVADVVVPFNERFNNAMDQIDDYYARVANGLTVVNGGALDERKMSGKVLEAGTIIPIYTIGEARKLPLSEIIHQFSMQIDPKILEYPNMLINFAQMLSGCVPQVFGQTVEGVDTAKGQQQALSQANVRFAIYWDNMKDEQAAAAQNAIECYQANMNEDMFEVQEENGSEFRNGYVRWGEMQGRVRVWPDPDAGLPVSPEDVRNLVQTLMQEVGAGNPIAAAWFDIPANQEMAAAILAPAGSVQPGAAQMSVTLQDLHKLVEMATDNPAPPATVDPQTGQPVAQAPQIPVELQPWASCTDFGKARDTVKQWQLENNDLRVKNPYAWQLVDAYYQLLVQGDVEQQVQENTRKQRAQAALMPAPPQPPPPDPTIQAAKTDLLNKARETVDRLDEIAHMPPQGQNGALAPQVSAANAILSAATKAATASN